MPEINKWQKRFLFTLMTTVFAIQGRLTFTNLARFSPLHEHTFRRQFEKFFDWIAFNLAILSLVDSNAQMIGALDCTFIPKSGKMTYGLDRFWSSSRSKAERGLEVSVVALIETASKHRFALDAAQTPPNLSAQDEHYSRVDFYME